MAIISDIVHSDRIQNSIFSLMVLVYIPLGVILTLLRVFLMFNYICAQIVFNYISTTNNTVRRTFDKVLLGVLGVVVFEQNPKLREPNSLAVVNYLSKCDVLLLPALCNYHVIYSWKLNRLLMQAFRLIKLAENSEETEKQIKEHHKHSKSVMVFPESHPTKGNFLLKFSEWPFKCKIDVQPITVETWRPFPISVSVIDSNWIQDLLWTFFCPLTFYYVTHLTSVKRSDGETVSGFVERIRQVMATRLDASCTDFTSHDLEDYIKKLRFEKRRPQLHRSDDLFNGDDDDVTRMAALVGEILPRVPFDVVLSDVRRTRSVDVTVTNLLEGVVRYREVTSPPPQTSTMTSSQSATNSAAFSRDPNARHLTLQEKKVAFLQLARENYIRKHKLS